ncbi:MAG: hypothetical protein HY747_01085 [Elusimicrobia bacterium]|nr:hypothetical protein [Elusimicrobiota bacterium]
MAKVKNYNQEPATKADLEALRADFKTLETKHDQSFDALEKKTDKIAMAWVKHEQKNDRQFEEIKNLILSSKSEILNAVDASAGLARNVDRLQMMQGQHLKNHDETLKNHEIRVKKLETASIQTPAGPLIGKIRMF